MLSLLVFYPIITGILLFFVPRKYLKPAALGVGALGFIFSLGLFYFFDPSTAQLQMVQKIPLIPFLGMSYFLGVDGLSFWYVILTAFLLPLTVLCSWKQDRPVYFFLLFLLCGTVTGTFLSFDGLLFFLFFDMTLIPLFFLIYLWGGKDRVYAAFKFLIYTFFASLFLLAALVTLMLIAKQSLGYLSASLLDFYKLDLVFVPGGLLNTQTLLFLCCALAFAVKTPLFPFHTWLPLAHGEAPTAGSVYLAAVVLKMGTYGWFRIILPLFPEASLYYSPLILFLAVFGLIYASLVAFAQTDLKKLVAYSSVAHIAFVPLGIFAFNVQGLFGGFYQTLTHAVSSAGLFLLVGLLYERTHTREIGHYGGLAKTMPWCTLFFFIITLSSIALPLTAGFVSEFLTLLGSFLSGGKWVWFAVTGVILSAVYMLNAFQKVFLGEKTTKGSLKDLNLREFGILIPLVLLVFLMGIFPNIFLKYSRASLDQLSANYSNYQLQVYLEDTQKKEEVKLLRFEFFGFLDGKSQLCKCLPDTYTPAKAGISPTLPSIFKPEQCKLNQSSLNFPVFSMKQTYMLLHERAGSLFGTGIHALWPANPSVGGSHSKRPCSLMKDSSFSQQKSEIFKPEEYRSFEIASTQGEKF